MRDGTRAHFLEQLCVSRALVALFFLAAGINHFVHPAWYIRIVPSYLPNHAALVAVSGICECLGGMGVLVSPLRRFAAAGLCALLVAVFPANLEMAVHAQRFSEIAPAWILYARLPLQLVIMGWVWWAAGSSTPRNRP